MSKIRLGLVLLSALIVVASCREDEVAACQVDATLDYPTSNVTELDTNHHRVYTDIVINKSAQEVWSVLTDFTNMPSWSTSLQGLVGDISDGGQVTVTYLLPDPTTGQPVESQFDRTLAYTSGVQFGWSAESSTFPGIVDNHVFRVEAISDCQSRFIQTDEFQGNNAVFGTQDLANASLPLYNQFNSELKARVEQ